MAVAMAPTEDAASRAERPPEDRRICGRDH
jgi:hypothetical protein